MKLKIFSALVVITGLSMIMYGAISLQRDHDEQEARRIELTQTICMIAHSEIDGASERACGLAQETLHTEFLCNRTRDICWTELTAY